IVSGGLLNLSNNTINGRVDYSGAVNHTVSGTWSITGGEAPNFGLVNTAQTDLTNLATAITALSGTSISNITTSRTLTAGVYDVSKIQLTANNNLTFSGSATDQFIVRVSNTFSINGNVVLAGNVNVNNVFFYYTGSTAATCQSSCTFAGVLLVKN